MPAGMAEYLTRDEVRACMDAVMGEGAADVALRVTVNVGVVRGGLKVDVMPGDCRVEADIRLPFGIDRAGDHVQAGRERADRGFPARVEAPRARRLRLPDGSGGERTGKI